MKKTITTASLALLLGNTALAAPGEEAFTFEEKDGQTVEAYRGRIEVRENRQNPDSRMIPVTYVRFPATSDNAGPPIIYLAGGPGGSGVRTAKYRRFDMFMALRAYGDVIALDQRGTGASDILPECTSSRAVPPTEPLSDAGYIALHRAAFEECLAFWKAEGVDVTGYNTVENARDIDALRQHLGAEKVVLWGTSYGSHLAFAALKEMGDHVEKVVLSSAEGLDQTIKLPARTDSYFDRLQAAVDSQPAAKAAYGDIKAMMARVHAKLDANPVLLHAKMKDGTVKDYLFHKRDMQQLASYFVSDPWSQQRLLSLYLAMDHDVMAPFEMLLAEWFVPGDPIRMDAMSTMMDVASGMSDERRALVKAQAREGLLGDWLNFSYHYDGVAPNLDLGDAFRTGPVSDVPVLLFSGTLDGRTYLDGQVEATTGLANLTHVTVVNAGHNLFMSSPEVQTAINVFMEGKPQPTLTITNDLMDLSPRQ
ncbi:alpha/beta hydrolase [Kordiimonas aestuarii]|uniref:alpha/beta hydrolase n=1 Tax=Kordiimonas aestuarii TaxID=1005925 RepID=UPI0021D17DC2|nr:alpha/beta hydrolase [Kordiimonas aestuarii]